MSKDHKEEFIQRVKAARKRDPERTQAHMADALQIERDKYKQYEMRSYLPQEYIAEFCRITGVSERWLVTGEGQMVGASSEQAAALWADFSAADDRTREAIDVMLGRKK